MYEPGTINGHFHISGASTDRVDELVRQEEAHGFAAMCFMSLECTGDATQNALGIYLKARYPRHYAFAGLSHRWEHDLRAEAEELSEMGFDGFKMLEGKPTTRKRLGIPVNDRRFDGFYDFLAGRGIPILSHMADPEEFWDQDAPAFAKENGWFYGDGSFVEKEVLYGEMREVLDRFPGLRMILPHCYFLSGDLERLDALLEKYPALTIDLTSGREMYFNFSKRIGDWKELFTRRADRFVMGNDSFNTDSPAEQVNFENINRIQSAFFVRSGEIPAWDGAVLGCPLPRDARDAIYFGNFKRLAGDTPRPLDRNAARRYLEGRLENRALGLTPAEAGLHRQVLAAIS